MKVKVKVTQSCLTLCDPMYYTVHGILQAKILEWVAYPFSRGSSQPRFPTVQVDSLLAEPLGKPKNTGMDSLSLLQGIFLKQELNWGLLHCSGLFTNWDIREAQWMCVGDIVVTIAAFLAIDLGSISGQRSNSFGLPWYFSFTIAVRHQLIDLDMHACLVTWVTSDCLQPHRL